MILFLMKVEKKLMGAAKKAINVGGKGSKPVFSGHLLLASLKKVVVIKEIFSLLWHSSKKVCYPKEVSLGGVRIQS